MRLIKKEFPKDLEKLYILPISDIHYGDPLCDIGKLDRYLDWAKNNNAYLILNGDLADCALINSIGNVYRQKINPQEQLDFLYEYFKPWKEKILGIVSGNHELRIFRSSGIDITKELARLLEVEYDMDSLIFKISLGSDRGRKSRQVSYLIYVTHGWGNGRTAGAKINMIESLNGIVSNADIYIASHIHKAIASQNTIFWVDDKNNSITSKKQFFISSGSFLTYGDYAERKGYRPAKMGSIRIRLDGTRKDVHISM